jgi:hypothetical protein
LSLTTVVEEPPTLGFDPATLAPGLAVGPNEIFPARQGAYAVSQARRFEESSTVSTRSAGERS